MVYLSLTKVYEGDEDVPNLSEIRDPRAWEKWRKSGALGRLSGLPRPNDIDTNRHFWDAFGNVEKEISARWIVRLCQSFGSWRSFTQEDLQLFYVVNGMNEQFWFNGLDDPNLGLVVGRQDGRLRVTERFVLACFRSSPAKEKI